jgi:hypothetical protein
VGRGWPSPERDLPDWGGRWWPRGDAGLI